jgi:hypothetical protein
MSKYGYEELQMLYEDGFRGDASDRPYTNYGAENNERLSARFPGLMGIKAQPLGTPTGEYYSGGEDEEEAVIHVKHLKDIINKCFEDDDANHKDLYKVLDAIEKYKKSIKD